MSVDAYIRTATGDCYYAPLEEALRQWLSDNGYRIAINLTNDVDLVLRKVADKPSSETLAELDIMVGQPHRSVNADVTIKRMRLHQPGCDALINGEPCSCDDLPPSTTPAELEREEFRKALVNTAYALNTLLNLYVRCVVADSTEKHLTIGYMQAKINTALRLAGAQEIDYPPAQTQLRYAGNKE